LSLRRSATRSPHCFLEETRQPIPARDPKGTDMLSARTKMIMAIACGVGVATGALTYLASHSVPHSLLAAGTATGSSADLLRQFIDTDSERPDSGRDYSQEDGQGGAKQRGT
jgi:hypothetical protein